MEDALLENGLFLQAELDWLQQVIHTRFQLYFKQDCPYSTIWEIQAPIIEKEKSHYERFISAHQLGKEERLVLILSLAPHLKPEALDSFSTKNPLTERPFSEFGGVFSQTQNYFIPTGKTALFLLAGGNLSQRIFFQTIFDADHIFSKHNIIQLEHIGTGAPLLTGKLLITQETIDLLTIGKHRRPNFSSGFPAKWVSTKLEWDDLVLHTETSEQIEDILDWISYREQLLSSKVLEKRINSGYKALFYGPSGTGKTLAACLLGKSTGKDVYKIDLANLVSKYIGETEKNLANVFEQAEYKDWILFFDEADALFGKRTKVESSHDRYANQEVSYLLQRIEDYTGLVILASNLKANFDDAFSRRFQSIISFPSPSPEHRLKIWQKCMPLEIQLEDQIDLVDLARRYELSGGLIANVVQYSATKAFKYSPPLITLDNIEKGIKLELRKKGFALI